MGYKPEARVQHTLRMRLLRCADRLCSMANTHNLPANRPDIALGPQGFFQLEQRHAPPHSDLARSTRARIGHSGFRYLPSYSPCPGYVSPPDCDQMETLGTG